MKKIRHFSLLLIFSLLMANDSSAATKYVFYLHGAIMEGQTGNVVTSSGTYDYTGIVKTFEDAHFKVISEIRKGDLGVTGYARHVASQVNDLLKKGVAPGDITVVGASMGALIAMYVSTYVKNSGVNYVFLAACNSGNFSSNPDIRFYGNILSIYEKSDYIGESCVQFKDKAASTIHHYKEVEINTGRGHHFLWTPMKEWVQPAIAWANGNYQ